MKYATLPNKTSMSAIAIVIAKYQLEYNKAGQAEIKLKIILGQKLSLLYDNNSISANEIHTIVAVEKQALFIANNIKTADEVKIIFSWYLRQNKSHELQLEEIHLVNLS